MAAIGKHGVTTETPNNIMLGAGTFHKNFGWNPETKKWEGVCIGATNGGGKVNITGEYLDIELDGALVLVKGLTVKQGGTASMEVNLAEITGDNIKMATNFKQAEISDAEGYDLFIDKPDIDEGDYTDGFAFVGKTAKGKNIIIIFESSLCKEAMELEGKNKEATVLKLKMDAYAENEGDLDTLPVKIYYPATEIKIAITIDPSGYDFDGGTYAIVKGTTWGEFATTYGLEIENTRITAQSGSAIYLLDSNSDAVNTSDVIVAGNYHWT